MKNSNLIKYLLFLTLFFGLEAKSLENRIIIKFKNSKGIIQFKNPAFQLSEGLFPEKNIFLFKSFKPKVSLTQFLKVLRQSPLIEYVQLDHPIDIKPRALSQDPFITQQWNLNLDPKNRGLNAFKAWDQFGARGLNFWGQDIVVAIVDSGIDTNHPDLIENIWINKNEIAGNKIDDDKNGYIDDIAGWNVITATGVLTMKDHATHIAGIIGAKGQNGLMGSGINWNIKMMNVLGSSGYTSTVIKAYRYVLKQKQLWISTNGLFGANVVAVNASFGLNFAKCTDEDYPAWNDIMNEMGRSGIINAAATANRNVNVDLDGDVPTSCDSPYMLSVTNTMQNGTKEPIAGYGLTTIDLGAPGTNICSTYVGNKFQCTSGTSMAAPHVAAAIAYLHSVAPESFQKKYLSNPAQATLDLKNIILKTVTPEKNLQGKTVTGGILNLNDAAELIQKY